MSASSVPLPRCSECPYTVATCDCRIGDALREFALSLWGSSLVTDETIRALGVIGESLFFDPVALLACAEMLRLGESPLALAELLGWDRTVLAAGGAL